MRLVLPRRTVRLRLTTLYGVLFLVSGAVLLAGTSTLIYARSVTRAAAAQQVPQSPLAQAQARIQQLQDELAAQQAQAHAISSHNLLISSAIALGVMTLASAVLGWAIAGRVLRPLRAMTAATRRISEDNLHERLALPGPDDELKDLGDTIDGLLGRLEAAFAAQRRFVANASHELRTPLTTMRASLDVAIAKPGPVPAPTIALAARLRTELDRVDRLLDGFLMLARAQHEVTSRLDQVSLGDLAAAALAARSAGIAARGLTVRQVNGSSGAQVRGNAALLGRMVQNVIDNAVGHNIDGGWIRVAAGTAGPAAQLTVESGGQLLDQRHVAQLGQPFRRLGADRTGSDGGTGLGLSIVAAIAAAHGGTVDLHARAGGGLRVRIGLPRCYPGGMTPRAPRESPASPGEGAG